MRAREYQTRIVTETRQAFLLGSKSVLIQSPTGSGKTVIGQMLVERMLAKGLRVLWLAHRRELVSQAASRFGAFTSIIMSGVASNPLHPLQVASIDTLVGHAHLPSADVVIFDEAHHAVARTYLDLLGRLGARWMIGLTATPQRSDGSALGDVFDTLVQGPSVRELISNYGALVECDVIGPSKKNSSLAIDPVDGWLKHAKQKPGFLFAPTVDKSREFVERLIVEGIPAAHVDGTTKKKDRRYRVEGFRRGKFDVLSSVGVFTEGVDIPRAAVCMLARGCGHVGTYLQMVGRVLRPHPGKSRALVIDLMGSAWLHGLPDDDREWSLEGKAVKSKESLPSISVCLSCGNIWRPSPKKRSCERCGWELPEPEAPEVVPEDMMDLRERLQESLRLMKNKEKMDPDKKLLELEREARASGFKSGWVGHKFRAIYGHWPTRRINV